MELMEKLKTPNYLIGYADSRIGGRNENQDAYSSAKTRHGYVVTVCDGMGGGPAGKMAANIATQEIIKGIDDGNTNDTSENIVKKAIIRANLAVMKAIRENPALKGMGSTCTVLLINENSATIAHIGDSRVYQLRGNQKVFRTFDHSIVFDLVRKKVLTEEQARLSSQSNIITKALGASANLDIDTVELPYKTGDRFMLTTDGIHGSMPEPELINLASNKHDDLEVVTDEIASTVEGKGRDTGKRLDNLTIALIETKVTSKLRPKMNKTIKLMIGGAILLIGLMSLLLIII